jgi:two-component system response regulator MprA
VLALPLQRGDGIQVCRRLREGGLTIPLLILDASDRVEDIVAGLEAGADSYMTWAMNVEEVRARICALVRRQDRASPARHARALSQVAGDARWTGYLSGATAQATVPEARTA